jgi:cytochrome P450
VARAADVGAMLTSPDATIGFAAPADTANVAVQSMMARFSDGADHDRRRAIAVAHLSRISPARIRETARQLARERLDAAAGREIEVMSDLARPVPVAALARELGAADSEAVVAATRQLCLALAPPAGQSTGDAHGAAASLVELVTPGSSLSEAAINTVALLFQTMDATAGLVGNATLAASRFGPAPTDELIAETNRFDPSVQFTSRVAARDVEVGGATVPAGQRMLLLLAAANRDPDLFDRPDEFDASRPPAALTFGTGARPCPGARHALELAGGILDAIAETGAALNPTAVDYEPRSNLRIPACLTLRFGGSPRVLPEREAQPTHIDGR